MSILYKSIAGRYRPVRVADGPITARYRFIKSANWVLHKKIFRYCHILLPFVEKARGKYQNTLRIWSPFCCLRASGYCWLKVKIFQTEKRQNSWTYGLLKCTL